MLELAAQTGSEMTREAQALILSGWCQGTLARDGSGNEVPAWSEDARSWSVLGALLATWHVFEAFDRALRLLEER